jgi:hypothetical protein
MKSVMSEESGAPIVAVSTAVLSAKKPKLLLLALLGLILLTGLAVGGVWMYNETTLRKPLHRILIADPRDHVVGAKAYFDGWIDTRSAVFDLTDVDQASQLDVFRVLLQYANEQQGHRYERIILAAYGKKKFIVPGEYFQQLGQEFDTVDPLYTICTFSHHVSTMDGAKAFPETSSEPEEEIERFTDFNKRWYLDDFIARHK